MWMEEYAASEITDRRLDTVWTSACLHSAKTDTINWTCVVKPRTVWALRELSITPCTEFCELSNVYTLYGILLDIKRLYPVRNFVSYQTFIPCTEFCELSNVYTLYGILLAIKRLYPVRNFVSYQTFIPCTKFCVVFERWLKNSPTVSFHKPHYQVRSLFKSKSSHTLRFSASTFSI